MFKRTRAAARYARFHMAVMKMQIATGSSPGTIAYELGQEEWDAFGSWLMENGRVDIKSLHDYALAHDTWLSEVHHA